MANEDKKDFNAMLHDNKDMPKFQIITDQKSIDKYGGSKMYFAPPIDYDKVMKKIPYGKVITVGKIREYFAKLSGADFTEPITAGMYLRRRISINSEKKFPPVKGRDVAPVICLRNVHGSGRYRCGYILPSSASISSCAVPFPSLSSRTDFFT